MKDGFVKVCAATPDIKVADCKHNATQIITTILERDAKGNHLIVFPELCLTGYTCGDLFLQDALLRGAKEALLQIVEKTQDTDAVFIVGLPIMKNCRLYNVAAVCHRGRILGMVPKSHIPNYSEFYEARHFAPGNEETQEFELSGYEECIPFGSKLLFRCENYPDFVLGVEICEDIWMGIPPSSYHAAAGATVLANLSASDEVTGKDAYRKSLVMNQSARLIAGYIYADAGEGESTTDLVFAGHNLIAENGTLLKESQLFSNQCIETELDCTRLVNERRRMTTFANEDAWEAGYEVVDFSWKNIDAETKLTRRVDSAPFVPARKEDRDKRCGDILNIQACGLTKRLSHTGCRHAVIGISGGLDSTLALLVTVKAFDKLAIPRENLICVTMPCFGTTDRTYQNAVTLTKSLGTTLREVPIQEAVRLHFADIGHDESVHDVTYENSQARERTQILMDLANQMNGMVIGTGDLSELALGWATYNGDHMSMYGVNCSVPKTLVRYLVLYYAETTTDNEISRVLRDVLDTPVSPELLPPKNGQIAQKTEDIVGPYELHDFFLYYVMRLGYMPSKIYRLAVYAFQGEYTEEIIEKWLHTFYWRFFSQQFKRSCLPDGPKVGSVALSPRGDWRMPSDAIVTLWKNDLEQIKKRR